MKFEITCVLLVLLSSSCVHSSPLGFKKFHKLQRLNPLPALGKLLSPSKPDVELIPLSEYPVWRLHHYKGLELKPVALPEAAPTAYPAPSTEFVGTNPKPEAVYGDSGDSLSILDGGFAVLDGVRDAVSTIGERITALPARILSTIGLGGEEDAASLLPALPGFGDLVNLPAAVLERLPKLPSLPLTLTNGKKKLPVIYVVVNKPEHKETPVVTYEPPEQQTPVTYEAPKPEYIAPKPENAAPSATYDAPKPEYGTPSFPITTYEAPKPEYGAPSITYEAPKPKYAAPSVTYEVPKPEYGVPYVPITSYEAPKPEYGTPSVTYEAPKPEYDAPSVPITTYEAPKPEYGTPSVTYETPKPEYGAPSVPTTTYEAPKPSYGAPQTPNIYEVPVAYEVPKEIVNTYEAPKPSYEKPPFDLPSTYENPRPVYGAPVQTYGVPTNSYGPPEGLVPPFAPSKSIVSSPTQNSIQVDLRVKHADSRSDDVVATPRATEKSVPDFKPSPADTLIVLPENKTQ